MWVRPDRDNAARVIAALGAFDAPLHDLTVDDLTRPGLIFQIGAEPLRIDILTAIDGVEFEDACRERVEASFSDQTVSVLSRRHLVQNKRAAAREQDLLDVKWLEGKASKK